MIKYLNNSSGQMVVLVTIVIAVVILSTLLTIGGSQLYYQNSSYAVEAEQAVNIAEAGVDKAIATMNKVGSSYSGELETNMGIGTYEVKITTVGASNKIIESTGYIPNKSKAKAKRTVRIEAAQGIGTSFTYGVQVGEGGWVLGNSNTINGSVYSNFDIIAGSSNTITGDAWIAGGAQPTPDQQTDCAGVNCLDYVFGTDVMGEQRYDVAQSFKPSVSTTLNKISVKVKKTGNPQDIDVRIMSDNSGKPNKNGVMATGKLYSSLVTGNYGWIDVTFDSTPSLTAETTYWIMFDTSLNYANNWTIQSDSLQSYNRGLPAYSNNWSAGNPTWTNINGDFSFKIYLGGVITKITGANNLTIGGDVHANTIEGATIARNAYYQTKVNTTVGGTSYPGSADPPPKVFPISEANIDEWKAAAAAGGEVGGINGCPPAVPFGPKKINGDLILDVTGCTWTIKAPIWVTGNIYLKNSNTIRLDPSYGSTSGLIIVGGTTEFANGNRLLGSGSPNSYLMLLSTYDSRSNGITAIKMSNTGNSGMLYADKGIMEPGNGNTFRELTAWKILLTNTSTINYETGLSSTLFSTGPQGSFNLITGTYQIK